MTDDRLHWQPKPGIESPALLELLETWREWAKADGLPKRARFDPIDFPPLLPWIILGEIIGRPTGSRDYDVYYRYIGTEFAHYFAAGSTTRMHLSEVGHPYTERWFATADAVLAAGEPCCFIGAPYGTDHDYLNFEMLALPFARDDGEIGFVMSAFARLQTP
jgi:hypothetical protein